MWCYQKPGFETLLLTELQRQQQCSQFCDTLLKAEGVSIPAHSCILSAISPHISSALSSTPTPAAGQSRLLEFRALGACTLLHLVRLLYSGEMAGEGEREKQQAISAAAKLGIHGLVEVTKRECKSRDGVRQCAEIGVQTEPLMSESEGRPGRWRREVMDGSTFLWKEMMSDGGKDMCTQTDELQINTAPPATVSYETIDISALQSIQHTEPLLVPPQIVPVSVVYPPDELTSQLSSAPLGSMPEAESTSVAVVTQPYTSVPSSLPHFMSQTTVCNADPQSGWADRDVTVAEEWEEEQFKQFQGNIPGFISYFLNPDNEEESCRGRAGRRRRSGVGRARRAGTGEEKPRRPRAGGRGRGRGGLTQMVQEVGVSRLQKLFLLRWGIRMPRTGQGGGAAGRKLCLQTREVVKTGARCERRRGRGKALALSQDVLFCGEVGGSTTKRGRKSTGQQFVQGSLPVRRPRRSRAKTATSASFFPPAMQFTNAHTLSTSCPSFQVSPSPHLPSPAASYASPASCLPVPAPPPHEDQPEQIDRLLEEVMMGLDILPNNNGNASPAQHPLPAGSNSGAFASSEITSSHNKPQGLTSELSESTGVAAAAGAAGCSSSTNGEVLVLEQQCEGELDHILDHFLQSFEQHVESCHAREEMETSGVSSTETCQPLTFLNTYKKNSGHTTTPYMPQLQKTTHRIECSQTPELRSDENESQESRSQSRKAHAGRAVSPKHTKETRPSSRRQKRRKQKEYLFSLEKKKKKVRKPGSSDDAVNRSTRARKEKKLQQIPVVKLERRSLLATKVAPPGHICQNLEGKGPEETKTISSTVKNPQGGFLTIYPIRSRFREAQILDALPFLEEPITAKRLPSAVQPGCRHSGRHRENDLLGLSNRECSEPPILAQPADLCVADEQLEKYQERHKEELTVQPHEEAEGPTRRGQKRGAESDEDTSDNPTVAKRACFETPTQPPTSKTADFTSKLGATNPEEIIDVETVSLTGDCLQEGKENLQWSELTLSEGSLTDEEMQSSADEIIDVDGDYENLEIKDEIDCRSRTAPTVFADLQPSVSPSQSARGSWDAVKDEVIDVIGGSSPFPEPVSIRWTESSEGEKEEGGERDVDVVGESKDSTSQ